MKSDSIHRASFILIITLLLSNVLGVVRDHYLAQKITTDVLDAYFAAFRIPDFLFNVVILGGISSAFIPVFTDFWSTKDHRRAWMVANGFLNWALVVVTLLSALLIFIYPWLTPFFVPNFSPEKQELTTSLGRLLLIGPIFFSVAYVMGGILNSLKRFVAYAVAPLLYNLSIIAWTILAADSIGVFAPVYGVVSGAALHMLIQLLAAYRSGYRWQWRFSTGQGQVRRIIRLMLPRSIGMASNQLLFLAFTSIGSSLAVGSVAIYNFSQNIYTMPIVVFGSSFSTAIYPTLAEQSALGQQAEFRRYFILAFKAIVYLLLPATVGLILLRAQIVRLILGSGFFGWEQTILALQTLAILSFALVPEGLVTLFARSFYAMKDTVTPTIIAIIQAAFGISLAYLLTPSLGVVGIAWALTLSVSLQLVLLFAFLRPRLGLTFGFFILPVARSVTAALVMGLCVWGSLRFMAEGVDWRFLAVAPLINTQTGLGLLLQCLVAIPVGVVSYMVVQRGLGGDELDWILEAKVGRRLEPLLAVFRLVIPYLKKK